MADSKISDLSLLSSPSSSDILSIVDVSDTTMGASGTTKKITVGAVLPYSFISSTGDTTDRRAEIQAALDALYASGGGTLLLGPGLFRITPTAGGLGILTRTGVKLKGSGGTIIEAGVGSAPFELVAPYSYNNTTSIMGAEEIDIENLTLRSVDLADTNCHGLLGVVHCPKTRAKNIKFGDAYYHAVEFNKCRNAIFEECSFIGQSNSSIIQFDDGGNAGQMSTDVTAGSWHRISDVLFKNCHIAARLLSATAISGNPRQIELSHSTTIELENIVFEGCVLGPCMTTTNTASYTVAFAAVPVSVKNLVFRNCSILGDCVGLTQGLILPTAGGQVDGMTIEGCFFGAGYDVLGTWCAGGFAYACCPSVARAFSAVSGASGYNLNWQKVRGVRVVNNIFAPEFSQGQCTATFTANSLMLSLCAIDDAIVQGNEFISPTSANTTTVSVTAGIHTFVTIESVRSCSFDNNKMHFRGTPSSSGLPAAGSNVGVAWTQIKMATDSVDCFWSFLRNSVTSDYVAGNVCAYTIREFGSYTPRGGWDKGNVILTNATAPTRWTSSSAWVS